TFRFLNINDFCNFYCISGILVCVSVLGYILLFGFPIIANDAEVIYVYSDVFATLSKGNNPYEGNHIYHRVEASDVVYGNFNYPPLEIIAYYLAYLIVGTWNATILMSTTLILHAIACLILFQTYSEINWKKKVPILSIILLTNLNYTGGLTLIFVSLFLALQRRRETKPQLMLGLVIGLGLLTKFFFGLIVIIYLWSLLKQGNFKKAFVEGGLGSVIAVLIMIPFGIVNVITATLLFQSDFGVRGEQTTYFPNIFSGLAYVLGIEQFFPILAIIIFIAFLTTRKMSFPTNLFLATVLSMFLFPTPEAQYLTSIFVILVWTKLAEARAKGVASNRDQDS
ncbi:MAG: hypothetical protein ACXAEI_18530, partial [Candidatus Hodarchaeales archaeon]